MFVRIAVLADFASLSIDNKLNILGIFRGLSASQVPTMHPQMKLVTQFEFDSTEAGDKQVRIILVDEDGHDLLTVTGDFTVARSEHGRESLFNQIIDLTGLVFPRFGDYEFRILINERMECIIPLAVTQVTDSSTAG